MDAGTQKYILLLLIAIYLLLFIEIILKQFIAVTFVHKNSHYKEIKFLWTCEQELLISSLSIPTKYHLSTKKYITIWV